MELSRIGANRKDKNSIAFSGKKPKISINKETDAIIFEVKSADGMGAQGQYDYTLSLSVEDIKCLLDFLAKQRRIFEDGPLQGVLESTSNSLLRLLIASSSLPFELINKFTMYKKQNLAKKNVSETP